MSEREQASIARDQPNRDREEASAIAPPAATASHPLPVGRGSPGKGRALALAGIGPLALVAIALWFAFLPGDRDFGDDLKRLQGVWKVSSYGRETQAAIRVEAERWTYSAGGMEGRSYRLTLRPEASPKEIDLVLLDDAGQPVAFTHGAGKGSAVGLHGVYAIDGDTVRVALAPGVEPRPKSLEDLATMTLTRAGK